MIDAHTHIFTDAAYRAYRRKARGRVRRIVTIHDILPGGLKDHRPLSGVLAFARSKRDISVVAGFDPLGIMAPVARQLRDLEALFRAGRIVGAKLYPGYNRFLVSDKRIDPLARLCARYGKPLVIHAGDVLDEEGESGALLQYAHPIHVDELAVRHRGTNIVVAHFGFPYILEAANVVSKNRNVYADISGTLDDVGTPAERAAMQRQYVADLRRAFAYFPNAVGKTLFGTDYAGEGQSIRLVEPYVKTVRDAFPRSAQGSVFHGLAERLFFS